MVGIAGETSAPDAVAFIRQEHERRLETCELPPRQPNRESSLVLRLAGRLVSEGEWQRPGRRVLERRRRAKRTRTT